MKKMMCFAVAMLLAALALLPASAQDRARARFVHVAPGLPAIDIYLNGELAVAGLAYGGASAYLGAPMGDLAVTANHAGSGSVAFEQGISLGGGATMFVAHSADAPAFLPYAENLDALPFGESRLNLLHAIDGGPAVDIVVSDTGQRLGEAIMPGDVIGPYELSANMFQFALQPAGGDTAVSLFDLNFPTTTGTSHFAIAHGSQNDPQLLLTTAAANAGMDTGSVRFVHAVAGATPFTLRANDATISPDLAYARPTEHIALPAGAHDISFSVGETEIASAALTVAAGGAQTVVIMGSSADLSVLVAADDLSQVDGASAVVSLINAIPDGRVDRLGLSSGGAAAADVGFGASSGATKIVAGAQSLALDLTIGEESGAIATPESHFYGGSYYNLIALPGNAFSSPSLLVAETSLERGVRGDMMPMSAESEPDAATMETAMPDAMAVEAAGVTALVNLNPGANLQLRQYPHPDSMSLGLAPAGTRLIVRGRRGPTVLYGAEPDDAPVDLSDFEDDPEEGLDWWQDLEPVDTWLFVTYPTPDGGAVDAWVNALYLAVTDETGGEQRLYELAQVRQNQAGAARDTAIGPPRPRDRVTAMPANLDVGVKLNIRVANDSSSENLGQAATGAVMRLVGLDEDLEWAFVEHDAAEGVLLSGWVSAALYLAAAGWQANDGRHSAKPPGPSAANRER